MSIKVMTWIWDNSPASGTELLMLLAIADQANDAGREAWPSIRTLAQRTRLDERTVRRVLRRLSEQGLLIVRKGGGRQSNYYEIPMESTGTLEVSPPLAERHPGQNAPGADSQACPDADVRAARAQLSQGSPDAAMPPDPSSTRPVSATSQAPTRAHESAHQLDGGGEANAVLSGLGREWTLTSRQRNRLEPKVAAALANGWNVRRLVAHLAANPDGVKSPAAVLAARLDDLPPAQPTGTATERRMWCGDCDEATRHLERANGSLQRCPNCHPMRTGSDGAGENPTRQRSRQAPVPRRANPQGDSTPHEEHREEHHQCPSLNQYVS